MFDLGIEMAWWFVICFCFCFCFDFEGLCVHYFIVMFWLKVSVSMNMLYMVHCSNIMW